MMVAVLAGILALLGLVGWVAVTIHRYINAAVATMCACIGDHDPEPEPVATSPEPVSAVVIRLPSPVEHREAA